MQLLDEIHSFAMTGAHGDVEILGTIAANEVPCIHGAILSIAQANARAAAPGDVGALAAAIDEVFHKCERRPGNEAVAEIRYGERTLRCTRTLH